MSEWQAIESAPKDGTWILAFARGLGVIPAVVRWEQSIGCFISSEDECELQDADNQEERNVVVSRNADWNLTHWMPLPAPPENPK